MAKESLTRRYFSFRSDIVGPVLAKVWDTPGSGFSERMKHLIEPTFALEYVPTINNSARVLTLTDSTDVILGGATRLTYGLNNRLLYRARTLDGSAGSTIQFLTVGIQQTFYLTPKASLNDNQYVSTSFRTREVDVSDVALSVKVTPGRAVRLDHEARVRRARGGPARHDDGDHSSAWAEFDNHQLQPLPQEAFFEARRARCRGARRLNMLEGRARGTYALTWDIGRAGILSQTVAVSYLAQCCGIQADFQKFKYPQASSAFPIPSDRRFNISFVLAGLGTFSNFFGAFGGLGS